MRRPAQRELVLRLLRELVLMKLMKRRRRRK
jgi:hypothetical protein